MCDEVTQASIRSLTSCSQPGVQSSRLSTATGTSYIATLVTTTVFYGACIYINVCALNCHLQYTRACATCPGEPPTQQYETTEVLHFGI